MSGKRNLNKENMIPDLRNVLHYVVVWAMCFLAVIWDTSCQIRSYLGHTYFSLSILVVLIKVSCAESKDPEKPKT